MRCLGTYLDVTERREAEDRRKDLLAKEQTARAEAERVIRMKDEFLATLSHELRTPLNAILGWSQLLRRGAIPQTEIPGALETIDRNARAQAQLIDDLLDMSRIVSGNIRLEMRPLDLEPVVTAAIKSIEPAASAKGIHLEQTLEAPNGRVAGDPVRLQQVFWNLLSNAVKFTPPGGHVRVSLVRRGATLEVAVSDTGAGIAPQFFPDLFQRFRQQDASTTRRHGGLGLGLSIARHLLELHGGSVHASSPGEGQGATFVVTLPALSAQAHENRAPRQLHSAGTDGPPGAAPVSLAGVRILAVDDEPDARELIGRILESAGASVAVVDSAAAALEWIARHPIDLLVSDIGMPQVDGYDLIRRVRRLHDPGASVPAIALTAYAGPEDCERALLAGYQAHVPKPLELSTLVTAVAEVVLRAGGPEKSRRPEDVVPLE
ncbi:MAG: response regulator [Acidobacteria bacterium]|nr:response regulator [Acidobacteriota bacterium]